MIVVNPHSSIPTSHDGARLVHVVRSKYLPVPFLLVRLDLFLDLLGEVLPQERRPGAVKMIQPGLHDHVRPAKRAEPLPPPRHLYKTPAAEHVLAIQSQRPVGDGEADRAQIVVELRDHRDELARDLRAYVLGNAARQQPVGLHHDRKRLGHA